MKLSNSPSEDHTSYNAQEEEGGRYRHAQQVGPGTATPLPHRSGQLSPDSIPIIALGGHVTVRKRNVGHDDRGTYMCTQRHMLPEVPPLYIR